MSRHLILQWAGSAGAAAISSAIVWVARRIWIAGKQLGEIGPKLDAISTNHLPHLQSAIEKVGEKQDQTNLLLAEQTGVLKIISENLK